MGEMGGLDVQGRIRRIAGGLALASLLLFAPTASLADEYDSTRSGHPLRVVGYVLYPIGLLIDTLVFRPAHWIASHEPIRVLFGHDDSE